MLLDHTPPCGRWHDEPNSHRGVKEFCDPLYKALLDSLQQHFAA